MAVDRASDIKPELAGRFSTTWDEMDWAYGKKGQWGAPHARISLWSGEHGVGKTRLLTDWMKRLNKQGMTSMISQGEVSRGQFIGEKLGAGKYDNIWVSDDMAIDDLISAIQKVSPVVCITDSVQQIEEYQGGRGAKKIVRKLRDVLEGTGTHVVFISQLTADGKSKGGTELPHEVDVEVRLSLFAPTFAPSMFAMVFGKNRYGIRGKSVVCCHKDWGVDVQSQHRLSDPDWVRERGGVVVPVARKKILGIF